jgi:hypothetical protein
MQHASCKQLHTWANKLPFFTFPFDESKIPEDGIYLLFQKGEHAHDTNRIVRVGTHTGEGQLRSRLRQHFLMENKDRSIFRKNIGRCLLNKARDPFLKLWEIDLTPKHARDLHGAKVDGAKKEKLEKEISKYLRDNFSFVVVKVGDKKQRLALESKLVSTLSLCEECKPSHNWLGLHSPLQKIRESGLWQVQGLYGVPLSAEDFVYLESV